MENKDDSFLSKSDSPQNGLRTPFDLVDDYQENGGVNGTPPKLICPNVWDIRIQLVDPETGEPIKREDLVKAMQDIDLEEAYPGTRKTNPELYWSSPYPTPENKNILNEVTGGMKRGELNYLSAETSPEKSMLCVKDKWFFYRVHQFHDVHHKRRKARFDKITFMLLRHSWAEYKESLYKKKYHIFDKTPRAKAERLALKRSREKIKSTLMIS
jgi:hypothetical protein